MKSKIVNYWLFTVNNNGRYEDIKVYGYECMNKREATQSAKQYGKIVNSITIYNKD